MSSKLSYYLRIELLIFVGFTLYIKLNNKGFNRHIESSKLSFYLRIELLILVEFTLYIKLNSKGFNRHIESSKLSFYCTILLKEDVELLFRANVLIL